MKNERTSSLGMANPVFPGVPRIESPAFALDALSDLTEEEKSVARRLNEEGYAVIDFPDPDVDARIERIKASLGPSFGIALDDPASDKTKGERRIQDAWKFNGDVRAIASNSAIIEMLTRLYGRRAFPFQTLNFPVGTQQDAHSDAVHFSSVPERFMCGVWLAMEDVDAEAGPLFYMPGSHSWPIVTNAMIGRRGFGSTTDSAQTPFAKAWDIMCEANSSKTETFLARKGQALIWLANLIHGGSPQTDVRRTRWSQVTHYFFDDCIYYTPAFSDEAVGRLDTRELVAINDGKPRPNVYLGERFCQPKDDRASKGGNKRLSHWLDRLRGRD